MLEEHLSSSHKRIETVVELEKELMKYRQQIEEMSTVGLLINWLLWQWYSE